MTLNFIHLFYEMHLNFYTAELMLLYFFLFCFLSTWHVSFFLFCQVKEMKSKMSSWSGQIQETVTLIKNEIPDIVAHTYI